MGQLLDRHESPLFGWAASPHYLGEILSFVGSAMVSALLPIWGNALVVSAYLASSADTTLKWHQREITRPRQVLRQNRRGLSGV